MTTTDAIQAAFLRDICERPLDDTPRLIFADWLEDHDQQARAGFIRLEVQIAEAEAIAHTCREDDPDSEIWCAACGAAHLITEWREEARGILWEHDSRGWFCLLDRCPMINVALDGDESVAPYRWWPTAMKVPPQQDGPTLTNSIEGWTERGFVARLRIACADWREHGPRLVLEQPLTFVLLANVQIIELRGRCCQSQHPAGEWPWLRSGEWAADCEEALCSALSDDCLNWAREQAGLPQLVFPTDTDAPQEEAND